MWKIYLVLYGGFGSVSKYICILRRQSSELCCFETTMRSSSSVLIWTRHDCLSCSALRGLASAIAMGLLLGTCTIFAKWSVSCERAQKKRCWHGACSRDWSGSIQQPIQLPDMLAWRYEYCENIFFRNCCLRQFAAKWLLVNFGLIISITLTLVIPCYKTTS
jgi:hypothetical protein